MSKSKEEPFLEILRNEIRFSIFILLNLYPELSYSEISQKLSKAKSTLHPHLKKLIKLELIEVSREEKVRGNIPANYYSLKKGYLEKLADIELDSSEILTDESALVFFKTMTNFLIKTLELYYKFIENMASEDNLSIVLEEMRKKKKMLSSMYFFSNENYKKVRNYYHEFTQKLNELEAEEEGLKKERPFFLFSVALPLKRIIENVEI
ncbi:MAG: winged helix-turn-helix domain-containing protein [Promethearchaeia archaeon]